MNAWSYLIVFNDEFATREEVQNVLNQIQEITYWYACLPNSIFFTSTLSAKTLAKKLESFFDVSKGKRFLITEIAEDRQGRLPREAWHLMRNPKNPRIE